MTDKPKRKYELTITAGADDLEYLKQIVQMAIDELPTYPHSGVSGGYAGNHMVELRVNPEQTHEKYEEELNAYLAKDEPKQEAAADGHATE